MKNIGNIDRRIRMAIALVITILYFTNVISGTIGLIAIILASVFALTSLIGFCPLYLPFGIRTHRKPRKQLPQ